MNRRAFLSSLAAALTLDPERLLWRPGAKLISVPKPREIVGYQRIPRVVSPGGTYVMDGFGSSAMRISYDLVPIREIPTQAAIISHAFALNGHGHPIPIYA